MKVSGMDNLNKMLDYEVFELFDLEVRLLIEKFKS